MAEVPKHVFPYIRCSTPLPESSIVNCSYIENRADFGYEKFKDPFIIMNFTGKNKSSNASNTRFNVEEPENILINSLEKNITELTAVLQHKSRQCQEFLQNGLDTRYCLECQLIQFKSVGESGEMCLSHKLFAFKYFDLCQKYINQLKYQEIEYKLLYLKEIHMLQQTYALRKELFKNN